MKNTAPLLFAVSLAGCASATQIYNSEVDLAEYSDKPLSEISNCLQMRWAISPLTMPVGATAFAMRNAQGVTLGFVSLIPDGEGTRIELRKTGQLVLGATDYRKCA